MKHPGAGRTARFSAGRRAGGVPGLLALFLLAALPGCALLPIPAPPSTAVAPPASAELRQFRISARVAVKSGEQGFSGTMRWLHSEAADDMLFLSPLGQGVARLERDAAGVTLTTADQRSWRAPDAESLGSEVLGWQVPLKGLPHWVVGRPAPQGPAEAERGADGLLSRLRQQGWQTDYLGYKAVQNVSLPARLVLQNDDLEIRLVIDGWEF